MIRLENVTKTYDDNRTHALDHVNINIKKGEFVFIVGDSGAGKSTLFKLLIKELQPTSGDIYVNGKRTYDFLKLYLIPERNQTDRTQNEQTMRAANAIKSQRIIELANGTAGIAPKQGNKILLADWLLTCSKKKTQAGTIRSYKNTYNVLMQFAPKARLSDVDRDFCLRFMRFLLNDCRVYNNEKNKPLAPRSTSTRSPSR